MFDRDIRTLAFVPRWVILRLIHQQSVAEHSYFVAIYADQIADYIKWKGDRRDLLLYALQHDYGEMVSGDVPHPAKVAFVDKVRMREFEKKEIKQRVDSYIVDPSEEIVAIVAVADMVEGILFLVSEEQMGNNDGRSVIELLRDQLYKLLDHLPMNPNKKQALWDVVNDAISTERTLGSGIRDLNVKDTVDFRLSEHG